MSNYFPKWLHHLYLYQQWMSFPVSPYTHQYLLLSFFISQFSSVQSFSHVQFFVTHGLQYTRLPCPSLSPGVWSNSCPLSQWCHPTISSSVAPFSASPQSFPASPSFLMSQLFPSGGQSIGASASTLVLPMNIQDWFPSGLTGLICLQSRRLKHQFKSISSSELSLLYGPTLTSIHDYWKNHSFD